MDTLYLDKHITHIMSIVTTNTQTNVCFLLVAIYQQLIVIAPRPTPLITTGVMGGTLPLVSFSPTMTTNEKWEPSRRIIKATITDRIVVFHYS